MLEPGSRTVSTRRVQEQVSCLSSENCRSASNDALTELRSRRHPNNRACREQPPLVRRSPKLNLAHMQRDSAWPVHSIDLLCLYRQQLPCSGAASCRLPTSTHSGAQLHQSASVSESEIGCTLDQGKALLPERIAEPALRQHRAFAHVLRGRMNLLPQVRAGLHSCVLQRGKGAPGGAGPSVDHVCGQP